MRRLLNTLYVTTEGAWLTREGETVLVRVEGETKLQLPIHALGGIVCFGRVSCSPPLLELCAGQGVAVSYMSMNGRFLARVQGPVSGNVLLRREQYRRADTSTGSAEIATAVVMSKAANCRAVLLRAARDRPNDESVPQIKAAAATLADIASNLGKDRSLETVRGMEGEAARTYFGVFEHLITGDKDFFVFQGRSRRPPLDPVNSLLSFHYTLLAHDMASALEVTGLDPAVGFLHRDRPGRPSLALDLMEELRPILADRPTLSLINRKQVRPKGFQKTETGAVLMDDATRKTVLTSYQTRKQEEITHPFLKEKIKIGLLPFVQAMLLARFLRGDMDGYPPFFWR